MKATSGAVAAATPAALTNPASLLEPVSTILIPQKPSSSSCRRFSLSPDAVTTISSIRWDTVCSLWNSKAILRFGESQCATIIADSSGDELRSKA